MMKRDNTIIVVDDLDAKPQIITTHHRARTTEEVYYNDRNQPIDTAQEDLPELVLPNEIHDRLFDHQREGVNWMYTLFLKKSGGILGDDMGLGKTFQVVSLLTGLMMAERIKRVLIIAPVSVLPNWERELVTHLSPHISSPFINILNSDMAKKKRQQILGATFHGGGRSIVISSHQMVTNMVEDFTVGRWDYVILDEGHVIKNPSTKLFQAMKRLDAKNRLLLTGTPIQNKLEEFWSVVDWATNGKTFGPLKYFTKNIADPIAKGQNPNANELQLASAEEAKQILSALIRPIFLQRKKKEQPQESLKLPEKKELVLWITLSTMQRTMYEKYIGSSTYTSAFRRSTYPVEVINYLKTLCRHPILIEAGEKCKNSGVDDVDSLVSSLNTMSIGESLSDEVPFESGINSVFDAIKRKPDVNELMRGSVKLRVLVRMVSKLVENDHRVLVFSQSKLMLQIIQYVLVEFGFASYRIDGSTNLKERQFIIDDFNNMSEEYSGPMICLLTTKACGTGITLTGADRVIIFDPSWNPAEDRQAVDRAFRIGQTKPVIVYRMIQASCVEEKIYEKQVFKEGLRVVGEKAASTERYVAGQAQLQELLNLGPANQVNLLSKLSNHMELLEEDKVTDFQGILGCSRHDELYKEDEKQSSHVMKSTSANQNLLTTIPQHFTKKSQVQNSSNYPKLTLQPKEKVIIDLTQSPPKNPPSIPLRSQLNDDDDMLSPVLMKTHRRKPKILGLEDDDEEEEEEEGDNEENPKETKELPQECSENNGEVEPGNFSAETDTGLDEMLSEMVLEVAGTKVSIPLTVKADESLSKLFETSKEDLSNGACELNPLHEDNCLENKETTESIGLEDAFSSIMVNDPNINDVSPIPIESCYAEINKIETDGLNLDDEFSQEKESSQIHFENGTIEGERDFATSECSNLQTESIQQELANHEYNTAELSNNESESTILIATNSVCSESTILLNESVNLLENMKHNEQSFESVYDGDSATHLEMSILNLVEMKDLYQPLNQEKVKSSTPEDVYIESPTTLEISLNSKAINQFMNPSIFSPSILVDENTSNIILNQSMTTIGPEDEGSITRLDVENGSPAILCESVQVTDEDISQQMTPICSNIDTTRRRRGNRSSTAMNQSRLESNIEKTPSVYSTLKIKAASVSRTANKQDRNSFLCLSANSDTSSNSSPPLINAAILKPRDSSIEDPRKQLIFDDGNSQPNDL